MTKPGSGRAAVALVRAHWWLFAGIFSMPCKIVSGTSWKTDYEGCYTGSLSDRMRDVSTMSECRALCTENFWRWAAVSFGSMCTCGYAVSTSNKLNDDGPCISKCSGNWEENCGGLGFSYVMLAKYYKGNMAVYKKSSMSSHKEDEKNHFGRKNVMVANDGVWPNDRDERYGYYCLNHFRLSEESKEPLWWKVLFHDHPFPIHSVQILTPDTSPKPLGCYTLTLPGQRWKKRPGTSTLAECALECKVGAGYKRLYAVFHRGDKTCYCVHKLYRDRVKFKRQSNCRDEHYEVAFAADHPIRRPLSNIKLLVYTEDDIQTECFHWEGELPVNKGTVIKCKKDTYGNTLKVSTTEDNLSLCEVAVYFEPIGCYDRSNNYAHSEKLKVTRTGKKCRDNSDCHNSPDTQNRLWCYVDPNPTSSTYEFCDPPECTDDTYEVQFGQWTPWGPCDKETHTRSRTRDCKEGSLKGQSCHPWKKQASKICQDLSPNKSCKEDDLGTAFRGKVSVSKNDHLCQPWHWAPNKLSGLGSFTRDVYLRELDYNFCRNADRSIGGPWCYLYGPESGQRRWDYCNIPRCTPKPISQGKPTRQSSGDTSPESKLAVDGSRDHVEMFLSCAHAMSINETWWEVDLEGEYKIASLTISSSRDVAVPPINAYVLRDDGTKNLCFSSLGVPKGRVVETPCTNVLTGKTVRIESQNPRNANLTLCEVEVWPTTEELLTTTILPSTDKREQVGTYPEALEELTLKDNTRQNAKVVVNDYSENDTVDEWYSADANLPNGTSIEISIGVSSSTHIAIGFVVALALIVLFAIAAIVVRRKLEGAGYVADEIKSTAVVLEKSSRK